MLNSRFKSWDCDNFIKKKLRHEASFPIDLKLMVETEQKKKKRFHWTKIIEKNYEIQFPNNLILKY
jgi:hypothetical protein